MGSSTSIQGLAEKLEEGRHIGDRLADAVIAQYGKDRQFAAVLKAIVDNQGLREQKNLAPLTHMVEHMVSKLETFDSHLLEAGQRVFRHYAADIMPLLGLYSLPYCYAAEEGSKVLILSKYLTEDPEKRLKETAEFVIEVGAPEAFASEGKALVAIAKVRLIHSYVRKYASSRVRHEVPVNQEDMVGTNLAFSLIVIRGLKKLGIQLSQTEAEAYLYLWRCVGELLGVDPALLPEDLKYASLLESTIRRRQFRRNDAGVTLTKGLLDHFANFWTYPVAKPEELMAYMMGEPVRSFLGLPKPTILTSGIVQAVSTRNFFRQFSERNYAHIFRLAKFDPFNVTPAELRI